MKFLLTSAGIKNTSLEQTLIDLIGRPMHEIFVVFVPTAASFGDGDKKWLIEDFEYFAKNCKAIDIVDISAVPKENWLRRFEAADVICFGGGDEQYLVKTMRESGVTEALPKLLETRVYMGISAGSMVVGKLLPNELTKEIGRAHV